MRACPICGDKPSKFNETYLKCPTCRLLFYREIPALDDLKFMYSGGWLMGLRRKIFNPFRKMWMLSKRRRPRERAERIFSVVRELAGVSEGTFLDIGCNKGWLLEAAAKSGFEPYGIEIAREQIRPFLNTYPKMKANIRIGPFPAASARFADGKFDAITAIDAIEHFWDPRESFEELWRILKPGGLVVAQTPDTESESAEREGPTWHEMKPMEHMHLFNAENLRRLATDIGFKKVEILPESLDAPDSNLTAVLCK